MSRLPSTFLPLVVVALLGPVALGPVVLAAAEAPPTSSPAVAPGPATPPVCVWPGTALPSQTRAVFVLDTSGSMRGIGDGKADMFGRVVASLNAYVRSEAPDRVELLTFDSGVRTQRGYALPAEEGRLQTDLAALRADGRNTHLYRSLQAALSPLTGAERYLTRVFVLTDGIDNDPRRRVTPEQALAAFRGRGTLDRLYYLALGTTIPAEAARALGGSGYAVGQTLPVGEVPDLTRIAGGDGLRTVTEAAGVPAPFADGTPLALATAAEGVRLAQPTAQGGRTRLDVPLRLPHGTLALLCAAPARAGDPLRPVLLRLNIGPDPALGWLNPGADRVLKQGETVDLRYQVAAGLPLEGAAVTGLEGSGLLSRITHQPGSRLLTLTLLNQELEAGRTLRPLLRLSTGQLLSLPAITGAAGGRPSPLGGVLAAQAATAGGVPTPPLPPGSDTPDPSLAGQTRFPPRLAALLVGLAAMAALFALAWRSRVRRPAAPTTPPAAPVPTVEGIEYREDRTLALVTASGEASGVSMPLGGAFDLGQLASVPHLSGLRAEQHRDGLAIVQVPGDLEVSQGARLLQAGDVVRPGTLLGVAVARPARAPFPSLGTLVGLGLPLKVRADGVTLHVVGPYGDHALTLRAGITDLGEAFQAPALHGLKVSPSGPRILLAEQPPHLSLLRPDDTLPLRPGTYLPPEVTVELGSG